MSNSDCHSRWSQWGFFFFSNDTATPEISTLSLHDALPIYALGRQGTARLRVPRRAAAKPDGQGPRSEEHTSELQSPVHLVCRLLLEKKKTPSPWPAPVPASRPERSRRLPSSGRSLHAMPPA